MLATIILCELISYEHDNRTIIFMMLLQNLATLGDKINSSLLLDRPRNACSVWPLPLISYIFSMVHAMQHVAMPISSPLLIQPS